MKFEQNATLDLQLHFKCEESPQQKKDVVTQYGLNVFFKEP
ncbi:hypothetical protein E6C60_1023 [Paenibacillus algicola]|uniref:Uncharacterized protein n=1 Tax=Paenibacillus algicola TaxID=2565926 RepID=A0A4P8XK19_9BACL|nr:hypothetical protein E6C60_1023 [Paenibacillus algicola]